jgi:ABC-type transport system involved in multi-copper enzyme maturation permease subunit
MYSEKSFKNYIFWIQVKRVFLIILLSCIGSAIGALIGSILKSALQISTYNTLIVIVSTLIFFIISLLLTAGTGKEVQDGYWKIALLRKLTVIQKNLELNNELLANSTKKKTTVKKSVDKTLQNQEVQVKEKNVEKDVKTETKPKTTKTVKKIKTLKVPEEIVK